jgi:hypothetical protein
MHWKSRNEKVNFLKKFSSLGLAGRGSDQTSEWRNQNPLDIQRFQGAFGKNARRMQQSSCDHLSTDEAKKGCGGSRTATVQSA